MPDTTDLEVVERPTDATGELHDSWHAAIEAFGLRPDRIDYTQPVTLTFNDDAETVTLTCDTHYSHETGDRIVHVSIARQAVVVAAALGVVAS